MFTGLIEVVGSVRQFQQQGEGGRLVIAARLPGEALVLGESIAVNGACLTVVEISADGFSADVSPETLSCTTLGRLHRGDRVNLERALRLGARLGGHLVSGHVDCLASVVEQHRDGNAVRFTFRLPAEHCRFLVGKGSVAIDGISLTVNQVGNDTFSVAIIPHTLAQTTLAERKVGDRVNIETDLVAKYVQRLFPGARDASGQGSLTLDFLANHGFV